MNQTLMLKDLLSMKMVKEHIQILLRLLATQFENEREDKHSNIRILLHNQAIKNIFQNRTFSLRAQLQKMKILSPTTLPVAELEMEKLQDKLLKHAETTIQPVTLTLPVKQQNTSCNSILTPAQKEEVFIGKCGECSAQHKHPKCDQCKTPRSKSGECSCCHYIKKKEEPYQGYCGNCFTTHEFPNCIQCQQYRVKPGRCTRCGSLGPDTTEWIHTCLSQDDQYDKLMEPILEARKKEIEEQSKMYTTYRKCPLCPGYFHSAKACIFRRHIENFNTLYDRILQSMEEDEEEISGKMVLPGSDEESDTEDEDDDDVADSDEEDGRRRGYLIMIHHGQSSDEESSDEEEEGA